MSDGSSKQTLMALLALDADDSVAADGAMAGEMPCWMSVLVVAVTACWYCGDDGTRLATR